VRDLIACWCAACEIEMGTGKLAAKVATNSRSLSRALGRHTTPSLPCTPSENSNTTMYSVLHCFSSVLRTKCFKNGVVSISHNDRRCGIMYIIPAAVCYHVYSVCIGCTSDVVLTFNIQLSAQPPVRARNIASIFRRPGLSFHCSCTRNHESEGCRPLCPALVAWIGAGMGGKNSHLVSSLPRKHRQATKLSEHGRHPGKNGTLFAWNESIFGTTHPPTLCVCRKY